MRLISFLSIFALLQAAHAAYNGGVPNGSPVPKNSGCSVASKPVGDGGVGCKLKGPTPREKPSCGSPHGAHFNGPPGTEVLATGPGVVERVGTNNSLGNYVVINHSANVKTSYGHLDVSTVRRGQRVDLGDVIGKIGKSGNTRAPGLHYMITQGKRSLNPLQYIRPDRRGSR